MLVRIRWLEMFVFQKYWCALFSCNIRFEIRPFLPYHQRTIFAKRSILDSILNTSLKVFTVSMTCH